LYAVPFDAKRLAVTGPETLVIDGIGAIASGYVGEYSVSTNGTLVYMVGEGQGGKSVMGWVDRNGVARAVSDPQPWGDGRLSPDGKQVANSIRGAGEASDVWLFDMERRIPTRLTFEGRSFNPSWTPDGRHVAYYNTGAGKSGIYWVLADGSGKPELLTATDSAAFPSSWTPDGKILAYTQSATDRTSHIWLLNVSTDAAQRKPMVLHDTTFTEGSGQISPDGRYVAYVSQESGANEVYVQPFPGPGAKTRISTQGGVSPRWSRNGRELFYWNPGRTVMSGVEVQPGPAFRASSPHQILKMFSGSTWDVAPDGNHFLVELYATGSGLRMETVANWFDELRRRVPQGK